MADLDQTHDPKRRSWVQGAADPDGDFPVQNLPFCVYRGRERAPQVGVGIGSMILAPAAVASVLGAKAGEAARACEAPSLNPLMALGADATTALRRGLSDLLCNDGARPRVEPLLEPIESAELLLPVQVGDYTDFYASVFHATNVGRLFRPDNPLLPNYKWVPIAYHGRVSSLQPSGEPVRRPKGQILPAGASEPVYAPSRSLDYELELGVYLGSGSQSGEPVPMAQAWSKVFGVSLLNDWSARDIQAWEYQPLGPFLSKNFATTLSPWVVTREALEPFRRASGQRPAGDPQPLPHLDLEEDRAKGGLNIDLEAQILSEEMRRQGLAPMPLSHANFADMYWTVAQMVAHHASGGCPMRVGDLLGSGTVSGPDRQAAGCLLEITVRGAEPVTLPTGEARRFLEDGDEVILRGRCQREGFTPIGLGECRAVLLPAG